MSRRAVCTWVAVTILIALTVGASATELQTETVAAWESYVAFTEARIESELEGGAEFLVMEFLPAAERAECRQRIQSGEVCVLKRVTLDDEGKTIPVPGGMIHHWYATVLVPDVELASVLEFVQSYDDRARFYPEVEDSRLLGHDDDVFEIFLRLKRKKIITVHYNTEHEVTYRTHSDTRASSQSLATRIREISNPDKPNESEKPFGDDRGFLWGLNSYWRFEQTEQGTVVECESLSLSRAVPAAARWLVKSYIDSVPRESLESTLAPIRDNLAP